MKFPYKILVLEDDPHNVKEMQRVLDVSDLAYDLFTINEQDDFQVKLGEVKPDIVLANYRGTYLDGMSAFHLIKSKHYYLPCIITCQNITEQQVIDCLGEGVDDVLIWSNSKRLPSAIVNAIGKKANEQANAKKNFELRKSYEDLRVRLTKQHAANEEERFHLARDIHDELGQVLSAIKIDISMFGRKVFAESPANKDELADEFDEIIRGLEKITGTVKRLSSGLRPEILDELGVIEAIRWLVNKHKKNNNIRFELSLPDELTGDRIFPITLYRIVQAALTNLVWHTDATLVNISLKMKDEILLLTITSDGKEVDRKEFRLKNVEIRERVGFLDGKLEINSRRPKGKVLTAMIPFGKQLRIHSYDKGYNSR